MGEEDMINIENPKVNEVIQGIHETLLRKVKKRLTDKGNYCNRKPLIFYYLP